MRTKKNVHKNDFGHVLVVAGSSSMLGAAALTGLAAMRSGAGLTTVAVAKSLNLALQKKISNVIMTLPLPETRQGAVSSCAFEFLRSRWSKYSSVAIGPGLTMSASTVRFVEKMYCACPLPLVVDADALNALALKRGLFKKSPALRVLTPHPGEMARLTGLSTGKVESDRKGVALRYARQWGCIIVLKGHRTVVASSQGEVYVNTTGNSGMATAGSGDVLTGMIAGLLAQGVKPFEAVCFGVYWHGQAGDAVIKERPAFSLLASDILSKI